MVYEAFKLAFAFSFLLNYIHIHICRYFFICGIMNNSNSSSTGKLSELNETNGGASSTNLAANAREQYVPVYKWSTEKVIEHLNKRLSQQPTQLTSNGSSSFASLSSSLASSSFSASSSPSTLSPDKLNRLNQIFTNMKINGEALLELNSDYIDYLNINDSRIK